MLLSSKSRHSQHSPFATGWAQSWFLIRELVKSDFKSRYNRSLLGMFWCVLQPALTMALLYFVFSCFFKNNIVNFPVYLITGTVFYQFFSETTSAAMRSIKSNASLISKVKIPLWIYPVTRAVSSLVNFLLALIPLIIVVLITRTPIRPAAWLLFYSVFTMLFLSLGIGMFLSALAVFFHDVEFLWRFACQLFMYATPIFYPDDKLRAGGQLLLYFNPLYHNIHFSRTLLISGEVPPALEFIACAFFGLLSMVLGMLFFWSLKRKFAQYL